MGPEMVITECTAEWVQRGLELNTGLNGFKEGHNVYREDKFLFLVGNRIPNLRHYND